MHGVLIFTGPPPLPTHTVTFAGNGGSGSMSAQVANVATNLTANTFTRAGYSFAGWNTAANGSGTAYADGASYPFTADATLSAQWTVSPGCVIGASGPGGGTIFYNDTARGMCYEYAPDGWNVSTPSADPAVVWALSSSACYAAIASAQGTAVGTGLANTNAITALCPTAADAPAAWAARNYSGAGLSDWFLPSLDELNQLCKYARGQSTAVADEAAVCSDIGMLASGFTADWYWASSQVSGSATFARGQNLRDGLQGTGYKDSNSLPVRPVRAWSVTL
jgi:hypothetical protein